MRSALFQKATLKTYQICDNIQLSIFKVTGTRQTDGFVETSQFIADASSVVGTTIGARLDWIKFAAAAQRLLPKLLAEPIPYVPMTASLANKNR